MPVLLRRALLLALLTLGGLGASGAPAHAAACNLSMPVACAHTFPSTAVGDTSSETFTITNDSGLPSQISVSLDSPNPDYSRRSDTCDGQSVDPGNSCTFILDFSPQGKVGSGDYTSQVNLLITADSGGGPLLPAAISGDATGPLIPWPTGSAAPASHDFGDVEIGEHADHTFTITSTSDTELRFYADHQFDGAGGGDYSIQANTCENATYPKDATCTVTVRYAPTGGVERDSPATLFLDSDAQPAVSIGLDGRATNTVVIGGTLTPASKDFGTVIQGESATQTFTLTSTGNAALDPGSVTLGGPGAGAYKLSANTCADPLAPTQTCSFTVAFAPVSADGAGTKAATVSVASNASPALADVTLTGNATPPPPGGAFSGLDLGTVPGGEVTKRSVTLTSTSTTALTVSAVSLEGSFADLLTLSADGCSGKTLAKDESCQIELAVSASCSGAALEGSLRITSNAPSFSGAWKAACSAAPPKPVVVLPPPGPGPIKGATGFTFTGNDGSSLNTGSMTLPGGFQPHVQDGNVIVPTLGMPGGSLSATVTQGTTFVTPRVSPPKPVPKSNMTFSITVRLAVAQSPQALDEIRKSIAKALAVSVDHIELDVRVSDSRDDLVRLQQPAQAKPVAPCTAATPAGAQCRVTWKLPKLPVGAAKVTLTYGGLSIPAVIVTQPALKVTPRGSRCLRRGGKLPSSALRVQAGKGAKVALMAIKLNGSRLSCKGSKGTTGRAASGKPRLVSKRGTNLSSVRSGLRKLGKGDYALLWMASSKGTPSAPQVTYLKVR